MSDAYILVRTDESGVQAVRSAIHRTCPTADIVFYRDGKQASFYEQITEHDELRTYMDLAAILDHHLKAAKSHVERLKTENA